MFGQKHVYTCPDSIHDHAVAKRNGRIVLGLYATAALGSVLYGRYLERKEQPHLTVVPDLPPEK